MLNDGWDAEIDPIAKVIIIIINWNNYNDTKECLISLGKITYPSYKVIVVDNNSTEGSGERIKNEFPQHIYIQNKENLGFAEGNNVGIRRAIEENADYVWILNNDVIVKPDSLTELVGAAEKFDRIGILGSKIYYYPDNQKIFSAGAKIIPWSGKSVSFGQDELDNGQYDKIREVDYISGCSLFVSANMLNEIGLLDKRYFMYYEEADLAVRARRRKWKVMYIPASVVWHKHASTVKKYNLLPEYYLTRNHLLFMRKNYPWFFPLAFIRSLRYNLLSHLLRGRKPYLRNALAAYRDYFCGNFGIKKEAFES